MSKASKANKGGKACAVSIRGCVQGVGFRPSVYRLARRCGLAGRVANDPSGAAIEIEGPQRSIDTFLRQLRKSLPPNARISRLTRKEIPLRGYTGFSIVPSRRGSVIAAEIPPDLSICEQCRQELFTPSDRRYRYPFINCTDCGPRFSIVKELPYDRPSTTMSSFLMCGDCRKEYEDPSDRRFHAQPDACPDCGPQVTLLSGAFKRIAKGDTALERTAELLRRGNIVAIKSIGGYHLACDAFNEKALTALRARKERRQKPFALMVPDLKAARELCTVSPHEEKLLLSAQRPVVLLKKRPAQSTLPGAVAPGNAYLGVMLPYTPLHYLLFYAGDGSVGPRFRALVMTSGNRRDEPICRSEEDAAERLSGIADYFLIHDRPIHNRCDDSLLQTVPGDTNAAQFIRRSRGYVPEPVRLKMTGGNRLPVVLATGAELKNTFCLTRGTDACVSPYIGDLDNSETLGFYREAIMRLSRFLKVKPLVIAHDLHPDYLSTIFAKERLRGNRRLVDFPVQHHQAHLASVLAEKRIDTPAIGFSFDGTGYGLDGNIWGGECFLYQGGVFTRAAHFEYFPLPGGDVATREIWRLAVSLLHQARLPLPATLTRRYPCKAIVSMMDKGLNSPLTSSVGRIFDGVAALAGIRHNVTFEAQAAMELEALSLDNTAKKEYNFDIFSTGEAPLVVSLKRTMAGIVQDLAAGAAPGYIGARFHRTLAAVTVSLATLMRKQYGISTVLLSGGVFQNRLLLSMTGQALKKQGFAVHYNTIVPPNDGGISLGQAWMALRQYHK